MDFPIERLTERIDAFAGKRVLVLGDLMLDEFTWGQVRRISPEAPVPVVEVDSETYRPGGSANVAANIRTLGGEPLTIGVVGPDYGGRKLRSLLDRMGIDSTRIVEDDRRTTLKTRIIAHGQQVVRADREDSTPLPPSVVNALTQKVIDALPDAAVLVVSDYDKGVVCRELMQAVLPAAGKAAVPVLLDPKVHHADYYRPVTLMTPNHREAELLSGVAIRDSKSLAAAGRALLERFGCPSILITRGEEGMSLFEGDAAHEIPASAREVFDVTGAGDTVVATMAVAHAAGAGMLEAAWLANFAAGVVVAKVGTAALTPVEMAAAIRSGSA